MSEPLSREDVAALVGSQYAFWPATYAVWRLRMVIGSPMTFAGGERVVGVLGYEPVAGLSSCVDVTMLVELPTQQPGDDMSGQLGDDPKRCPSCGEADDHNWMRSAGGWISCQKRTEAHQEGT